MGKCYSRLMKRYNNQDNVPEFKYIKQERKAKLKKLTNNFYYMIPEKNKFREAYWSISQISLLKKIMNFKIINPIPLDYCKETIYGTWDVDMKMNTEIPDMILLNYDKCHGKRQSLRGFACLTIYTKDTKPLRGMPRQTIKYLKIDLIGNISLRNKPALSAKLRHNVKTQSGQDMINYIKNFAIKSNMNYITLNSMEQVIGFYWKQGWSFKKYKGANTDLSKSIWGPRVAHLNKIHRMSNNNMTDKYLLKYFDRFLEGYYNERELSETNSWDPEFEEYEISNTLHRQRWNLRFNGYKMYWFC